MEGPASGLEAYLEWQERLKRFESGGLPVDEFCQQEEVRQSTFLDWLRVLRSEQLRPAGQRRSAEGPAFVPVTVRAGSVEILLPGGGLMRFSAGIDRALLMDIIRTIGTLLREPPS